MKYKSKKGTVINIPDGLTPQQIKSIKADADAGYGTRAQKTANELANRAETGLTPKQQDAIRAIRDSAGPDGLSDQQKESIRVIRDDGANRLSQRPSSNAPQSSAEFNPALSQEIAAQYPQNTTPNTGATGGLTPRQEARLAWLLKNRPNDPQVAKLQALKAQGGGADDGGFNDDGSDVGSVGNKKETDDLFPGNTGDGTGSTTADPDAIFDKLMKTPDFADLQGNIASAREGMYKSLTRDFATNKARDLEASKQELAERGIPYSPDKVYDPNTTDLYGKTIGGIDRSYKDMETDAGYKADVYANDQGTTMYNSLVASTGQANEQTISTLLKLNDQQLAEMGLNREYLLAKREQKRKEAADKVAKNQGNRALDIQQQVANKPTGGGGGGGNSGGAATGGFDI